MNDLTEISMERFFAMNDLGGYSLMKNGARAASTIGYALVDPDVTSVVPDGVAILTFRQNNVIVPESGIPASRALQHGMIYADINGAVKTGLAIANPADESATVSFYYVDSAGKTFGNGSVTIPAGSQVARFLDQTPFNSGPALQGTLVFDASIPVFVAALRGFTNERSEFIISTQPVAEMKASYEPLVLPHFADGGGWMTQIVLLNPTSETISGSLQFTDASSDSPMSYSILPRSHFRYQTSATNNAIRSGAVRILTSSNTAAPVAFGILSFRNQGVTVTEASITGARAAASHRMYVELQTGIQAGIAIANPSSSPVTVNLELAKLTGEKIGITGALTIGANAQVAAFLNQIPGFQNISTPFQGILRISSASNSGLAVAGLRGRYNERGDFLITTIPSPDENESSGRADLAFPHFVYGGGYSTEFVLFSGTSKAAPTGVIRLFDQAGQPINAWQN